MTDSQIVFPLSGVIGIVDSSQKQIELAQQFGLKCVEIRADLLSSSAGLSNSEILSIVSHAKEAGLACLFTLRHADQGGTFNGAEAERVSLCTLALDAGADIIDLEHGTDSADSMLAQSAPMILSYHNFNQMLSADELAKLSADMEAQMPAAVKIIPTGQSLSDAATMMSWVRGAGACVKRIGFSMGSDGAISRILALNCGSPITYASFGEPVAPGQVDIKLLIERYQCMRMNTASTITAVVGEGDSIARYYDQHENEVQSSADEVNVCIDFASTEATAIEQLRNKMNFNEIVYL